MRILISEGQVKEPEQVMRMQNAMLDKLAAIPGVTSVALAGDAPLEGLNNNDVLFAEDKTYAVGQIPPIRRISGCHPGILQDHRHASDRRARFHLDRSLRKTPRSDGFRKSGPRNVGRPERRAGQTGPGRHGRPVARDRGRGRRRLRRRRAEEAPVIRLLASPDGHLLRPCRCQRPALRRIRDSHQACGHGRLSDRGPARRSGRSTPTCRFSR